MARITEPPIDLNPIARRLSQSLDIEEPVGENLVGRKRWSISLDSLSQAKSESQLENSECRYSSGHWLVDHNSFNLRVGMLVLASIEIDYPEWEIIWLVNEHVFTGIFTTEIGVKVWCMGARECLSDILNWLDVALVFVSALDARFLAIFAPDISLRAFSVFRIVRFFRLARVVKLVKIFKSLYQVLVGVFDAMKTTIWVALVLVVIVYIFSMFCVSFIGKSDERSNYPGFTLKEAEIDWSIETFNPYTAFGSMKRRCLLY